MLAYVWTGSSLVNERLVREGWAVLYTLPPNVKYAAPPGAGAAGGTLRTGGPVEVRRFRVLAPSLAPPGVHLRTMTRGLSGSFSG